ncbi:M23 family metallopeptidase [Nocardia acididurans]|uniref:M23 family metallopeptidase n=1 Tax=Nocardia acididurans TaxID=2802282 RepID=UPI0027DEA431|nr:M23 family metallopeptidase [Nocardia acididurans]
MTPGSVSVKDLLGEVGTEVPTHRADVTGRFRIVAGAAVTTGALLSTAAQLTPAAAVAAPVPPPADQGLEGVIEDVFGPAAVQFLNEAVPGAIPAAPQVAEAPEEVAQEPAPAAPAVAPFGIAGLPPEISGPLAQAEQVINGLQQQIAPQIQQIVPEAAPQFSAAPAVLPVGGEISSNFGSRWGSFHYGVDIADALGTPIHSVLGGTVIEAGQASGFGQWVRVQQDDGTIAVYGHVNEYFVQAGDRVNAGDVIATVGNRGQSTGPHLHLEIWDQNHVKIDPVAWLATKGVLMEQHWGAA